MDPVSKGLVAKSKPLVARSQARRIQLVDRIVRRVSVQVCREEEVRWIFGGPAPNGRIVVPAPKSHKTGVLIVETTCESKRNKAWRCILQWLSKLVEVARRNDTTCSDVDDPPRC